MGAERQRAIRRGEPEGVGILPLATFSLLYTDAIPICVAAVTGERNEITE